MKAVKTIAALIFLSAIAIVLVQPVLGADDEPPRDGMVLEESDDGVAEGDGDENGDDAGEGRGDGVSLTARYPGRCLRKTGAAPSGLLAARRGSTALIGLPGAVPAARVEVSGDVAWSPSGTFLAERGGRVFDQRGNPQGALFFEPREWQWSPVADCALATTEHGNLTFSIPDTRRKGIRLVDAPVEDFELSPNGRRLAMVIDGRGLWIADLRRGRVVQATEGPAAIAGWFSNRSVLYSKSRGAGKLRYATGRGDARVVRGAFAGGAVVRCGGRVLLVAEASEANAPLAELRSRRGRIARELLPGPPGAFDGYSAVTCSPDGGFLAASTIRRGGKGPLVLLSSEGEVSRQLAPGRTANPQWSDEGLVFVRFGSAGRGRLWLVPPGAPAPVPTQYRVGAPTQYDWHVR
ncbi:MAG TPA: hypothetical protein VHN37_14405 [Actinomycetota bacterium]|nr:hypothetical protein [Actinomycetota bacterium]